MDTQASELLQRIRKIDALVEQCSHLAYAQIEKRARTVLRGKNGAKSFCMAMGHASFYDKNGNSLDRDMSYLKGFYGFAGAMNERFNIYGWPMKLNDAISPRVTDW